MIRNNEQKTITIELDSYEAANLLYSLWRVWQNKEAQELNTGDWVGTVPQTLAISMREAGGEFLTYEPNGFPTDEDWEETIGYC